VGPLERSEEAEHAPAAARPDQLAEQEAGGRAGAEPHHGPRGELTAPAAPDTACHGHFHAVNLIPLHTLREPSNPMSDAPTPTRLPTFRLVLLGVLLLIGVVLYFSLGRRTQPVVTPASVEETP
jgi:hypothetical protein